MIRLVKTLAVFCLLALSSFPVYAEMVKTQERWGKTSSSSKVPQFFVPTFTPDQIVIRDPLFDDITSNGNPIVDITQVQAGVNGIDFTLWISFSDKTDMNQVVGIIDIDTDENPATGGPAAANFWIPGTSQVLGSEFSVDAFDFHDTGTIWIKNMWGETVGSVSGLIEGKILKITIPLSLLGNDDGYMRIGMVLGNREEPTDAAPNDRYGQVVGVGKVEFSPPSTTILKTQNFDLVLLLELSRGRIPRDIKSVRVTLDGKDISEFFLPMLHSGSRFDDKGWTYRLPNVNLAFLEPGVGSGIHTLSIEMETPDGVFRGHADYNVIQLTED